MPPNKPATVTCAQKVTPASGVKRFKLSELFASHGCGIDHSDPHRLRFHVALLVTVGSWEHLVDFSGLAVSAGDLLLLRAGQVHAFGKSRQVEGEILTFTPEFLATFEHLPAVTATAQALFDAGPNMRLSRDSSARLASWYAEFSSELALRGSAYAGERITHSFALLVNRIASLDEFLAAEQESVTAKPRFVRDFEALLESNFLRRREPAWYATNLGASTRTLDRRLMRALKITCKEAITARLVLEAKRLLADSDLQVKNVAHSLHFDEIANFSRFFRHNAGLTPREFKSNAPDWLV